MNRNFHPNCNPMDKLYRVLIPCVLIAALSACQKGSTVGAPYNASNLILGKWNLQTQKTVIYANNLIQLDTTCVTSSTSVSYARFNKNNTFNSVSLWSSVTGSNANLEATILQQPVRIRLREFIALSTQVLTSMLRLRDSET